MAQDWNFWRQQIAGGHPELELLRPEAGFYRRPYYESLNDGSGKRRLEFESVAIWLDEAGRWQCLRSRFGTGAGLCAEEIAEEIFAWCCRDACTYEEFEFFSAHGRWPTEDETAVLWSE